MVVKRMRNIKKVMATFEAWISLTAAHVGNMS
jgi:hypothetical protein